MYMGAVQVYEIRPQINQMGRRVIMQWNRKRQSAEAGAENGPIATCMW